MRSYLSVHQLICLGGAGGIKILDTHVKKKKFCLELEQ